MLVVVVRCRSWELQQTWSLEPQNSAKTLERCKLGVLERYILEELERCLPEQRCWQEPQRLKLLRTGSRM